MDSKLFPSSTLTSHFPLPPSVRPCAQEKHPHLHCCWWVQGRVVGPREGWGVAQAQPHSRKRPSGSLPAAGQSCSSLRLLGGVRSLDQRGTSRPASPFLERETERSQKN